jgi:superfamily II DNA or RNA helicase
MILLIRYPAWTWASPKASDPFDVEWLKGKLTIKVKGFDRRAKKPCMREMCLFSGRSNTFPAGLFPIVEDLAKQDNIKLRIVDKRPEPPPVLPLPEKLQSYLYDYQQEAVEAILERRSGIIKLPTGSGKTNVAVAFAMRANCRVAFLVDETSLLQQAANRWKSITGKDVGTWDDPSEFNPVTLQTLKSKLEKKDQQAIDFVNSTDCVIFDECHIGAARTYYRVTQSFRNTIYRLGLSATPIGRSDSKDLMVVGSLGPIIYEKSVEDLQGYGRLAKGLALFYRYPGGETIDDSDKWLEKYRYGIVKNEARNRSIVRICKVTPKPVLVFFDWKQQGFELLSLLQKKEISCDIVYGVHDTEARERAKKVLAKGEIDVLLCSKIFNKGQDIPEVRSAINAAGMKAFIMSTQKPGRTMRTAKGKSLFVYWDLLDDSCFTLLEQSRRRASTYMETMDVKVVKNLKEATEALRAFGILEEV